VLPKTVRLADFYAVEVTQDEEIILRPRALVDPRAVVSKKTLLVLDESMKNLAEGRAGEVVDLSAFDTGGEEDEPGQAETRPAKRRR
jgi:hypothetical protein